MELIINANFKFRLTQSSETPTQHSTFAQVKYFTTCFWIHQMCFGLTKYHDGDSIVIKENDEGSTLWQNTLCSSAWKGCQGWRKGELIFDENVFFYLGASKGSNWSTKLWTQNLSSRWLSGDQPMHRRSFSTWFGRKEVSSWPQVDKVIISHILRRLPERSWSQYLWIVL